MKQGVVLLPLFSSAAVIAAYALRRPLQMNGLPFDPYYTILFLLPLLFTLAKKFSFDDLGIRLGKPLTGIFLVFLLPAILFFRRFSMDSSIISFSVFPTMLLIGSFAEEFFFRGYLQEDLKKRLGGNIWISLTLSNIVFALVHLVKGYSLPASAMTGLIGAYFGIAKDEKGGNSLFYSVAAHGLYNLGVALVI